MSNGMTLGHIVQFAGTNMDNAAPLASHLEVKSTRVISLLHQFCDGSVKPDENDVFPSENISSDFKDCTGFSFQDANIKLMYKMFVRQIK